jgi:serine phosphatase RsbU (regulator of sigma subunit)
MSVLETVTNKSAKDIDMKIKENLIQFIGSEPQFDDITMITLKYFGPQKQEVDNGKTI